VWAGTRAGLARLDGAEWVAVPLPGGDADDGVNALYEMVAADGTRSLLAGTVGGRLVRFDGATWTIVELPTRDSVTCLVETIGAGGKRALWVGTDGGGLLRWQDERWRVFTTASGMPNNSIWSLLTVESTGGTMTLWIGTDGGAGRMQMGRWTSFDTGTGLPTNSIYGLRETHGPDGTRSMWFGTRGGGLARVRDGVWKVFDTSSGLPTNSVFSLFETTERDGSRTLWAGTNGGGLARFENERWRAVPVIGTEAATVRRMVPAVGDDGAPEALGATGGKGIIVYRNGQWSVHEASAGLPSPNLFAVVQAPAPGGRRAIWVGMQNGGAARWLDGQWTAFTTANSKLPNNSVLSLHATTTPAGRNVLWAGTEGGGAARLDLDDPSAEWAVLSDATVPALPNNTVYQIVEDARRRLYLTTNRGVARLTPREPTAEDPSDFRVTTFTTEDGLPSNEFNGGASHVDAEGRIWAGTPAGAAVYDPAGEIEDDVAKPLYVEARHLSGGNRPITSGDALRYNQNSLTFEYTLLSYHREHETQYRTQLVGLHEEPSAWRSDYKSDYPTLPPGAYTFRVWARDYAGNVSGPIDVPFEIRPAPWQTWWAYLIYLALLAGAGYLIVRYRLAALERANQELESVVADRTAQLGEKVAELEVSERNALQAKEEALEAREEALEATKAKSVFLSNMSHELRTPLNAVLGFAQLMERKRERDEEDRENLGIIMRSGEHLLGLINDVLSISKIEAGRLTLNDQPFDLRRMLQGLEEMISVRAQAKALRLVFDLEPDLPTIVQGDEGKLRQVLLNLLGNAVKFTDVGGVALRVRWEDGRAFFEIEDTGQGIAPEEVDSIFDAFVQSESGRSAKEGTGLGLAISRNFVQLMGGDIRVRSEVGVGTVFLLDVALPEAEAEEISRGPRRVASLEAGEPAYRILVADDRWENRALLVKLLKSTGFEVREATNGREAVDAWAEWRPDLIWMDMRMPVMDGKAATAEIRRREETNHGGHGARDSVVKIVALTASAFEHERGAVLEAGCDDFVTKPYRESTIFEKLTEQIGARFRYEAESAGEEEAAVDEDEAALTSERLSALPRELVAELRDALVVGNVKEAQYAVDNIGQHDTALADELRRLVRGYQFDEILDTIEMAGLV
jgi:signal transduction histidine kinase/CheY-like chemotaxis protein